MFPPRAADLAENFPRSSTSLRLQSVEGGSSLLSSRHPTPAVSGTLFSQDSTLSPGSGSDAGAGMEAAAVYMAGRMTEAKSLPEWFVDEKCFLPWISPLSFSLLSTPMALQPTRIPSWGGPLGLSASSTEPSVDPDGEEHLAALPALAPGVKTPTHGRCSPLLHTSTGRDPSQPRLFGSISL